MSQTPNFAHWAALAQKELRDTPLASLDREERKRTLGIALDEVAGKMPVVSGVYSDGTLEAVDLAPSGSRWTDP